MTSPTDSSGLNDGRFTSALRLLGIFVSISLVVVLGRVIQLQVAPSDRLLPHIQERISHRVETGRRGDLLDRRGRVMAATRDGFRLFVDPSELKPPYGAAFAQIASVTGVDLDTVAQRIIPRVEQNELRRAARREPIRYVSIGTTLQSAQLERARRLSIPGVHLERRSVRQPLVTDDLAPLLGVVGVDHNGLVGAELTLERDLAPQEGRLDFVRDAQGRAMWVEPSGYVPADPGEDVRLSIDLVLQEIGREELIRGVERADAAGGRLIMADPATGEILAMVDHAREVVGLVEPPKPGAEAPRELPPGRYRTIRPDPGAGVMPALARNRCVEEVYEPGSTFKPFIWGLVTQLQLAGPSEVFDTHDGIWRTPFGRRIEDVIEMESMTWSEVLVYSSNIGMVQGTSRLTHDQMRQGVLGFGFGAKTNVGLPGEATGIVTSRRNWSKYTQSSVASGYEVAVTPLQMVRAFSALARSGLDAGTLPELRLRLAEDLADAPPIVRPRVLEMEIALLVRAQLELVAQRMNERILETFPDEPALEYSLFGKSGTAEIARPDGKGYFDHQYNSSFIAGAPLDEPRLVVLVVIDDPGPDTKRVRQHYGSWVAGPVVRRVMQRALAYQGEPMDRPSNQEEPNAEVAEGE